MDGVMQIETCSKEACLVDERTGILSVCTQHGSDEEWRYGDTLGPS